MKIYRPTNFYTSIKIAFSVFFTLGTLLSSFSSLAVAEMEEEDQQEIESEDEHDMPKAEEVCANPLAQLQKALDKNNRHLSQGNRLAGASHIYHIGAAGFFVNDANKAHLNASQISSLKRIKEDSLRTQSSIGRKIKAAEEEIWLLTASNKPDLKKIEAKIEKSESLKVEKRISFIRSVDEAAKLLTPAQKAILLGASASPVEPAMKPMGDM